MELSVKISQDFDGTIVITDLTQETSEYVPEETEEVLTRYYNFKYSETCTLNVLKYISTKEEKLLNVYYSEHTTDTDSIRIPLKMDGYYSVDHIVLPTTEWLEKIKDLDLSEYQGIYVTDGNVVYKYSGGSLIEVDIEEIVDRNTENTTISISRFKAFNIAGLKNCYINLSTKLLNSYGGKCDKPDSMDRFNRDFVWMTINVINYYLEEDFYSEAQIILEGLGCNQICADTTDFNNNKNSCGCHR